MQKILVLGANSAIAQAACRLWHEQGHRLYLASRDLRKLEILAADLKVRGPEAVFVESADLRDSRQHESIIAKAAEALGGLDLVFVAFGILGDHDLAKRSIPELNNILESNFLSQAQLLTWVANYFESQRSGKIIVITSVAGDRGRQSNYIYGAAKGGLSLFLSGLRNRLFRSGVQVVDLKLGFVDTPMTAEYPKGPLWASPQRVGKAIVKVSERANGVVYIPFFWYWVMLVIRSLPEALFKRLRL